MAKAPPAAPADAAAAEPAQVRRRPKKLVIIVVVLAVILLLLAAGVVGLLMLKKNNAGADEHAEEHVAAPVFDLSKPPTFIALEPFTVNLSPAEGERYLQVVLALRIADAKTGESLKGFMPSIRHEINLLLAGKLPSELSTPEGREALADEIVERTNSTLGAPPSKGGRGNGPAGPIQAVLFDSFIIQ